MTGNTRIHMSRKSAPDQKRPATGQAAATLAASLPAAPVSSVPNAFMPNAVPPVAQPAPTETAKSASPILTKPIAEAATIVPSAAAPNAPTPVGGGSRGKPTTSEPAVIGASVGPFRVELTRASYDVSGKPGQGCATFDTHVPRRRLMLVMTIVNDTDVVLKHGGWGVAAYAGNPCATRCLSDTTKRMPDLAPGAREHLTFVPPDSAVTALDLNSTTKLTTRVCFNEEQIVACASASK